MRPTLRGRRLYRNMQPVFALQPLPKGIFLAGPTPRDEGVATWRPEALKLLEQMGFNGNVYVPEQADWSKHDHYDSQIAWEWEALAISTAIVFWVPRELKTMPAFTTNVEFGFMVASGKCLLGYPEDAPKMRYLEQLARRHGAPVYHTLTDILQAAIVRAGKPY